MLQISVLMIIMGHFPLMFVKSLNSMTEVKVALYTRMHFFIHGKRMVEAWRVSITCISLQSQRSLVNEITVQILVRWSAAMSSEPCSHKIIKEGGIWLGWMAECSTCWSAQADIMLADGEPTKRVLVERKDLSKPSTSTWLPSTKLFLVVLVFCSRRLTDSTTSVIGGLNSFSGCLNSKQDT